MSYSHGCTLAGSSVFWGFFFIFMWTGLLPCGLESHDRNLFCSPFPPSLLLSSHRCLLSFSLPLVLQCENNKINSVSFLGPDRVNTHLSLSLCPSFFSSRWSLSVSLFWSFFLPSFSLFIILSFCVIFRSLSYCIWPQRLSPAASPHASLRLQFYVAHICGLYGRKYVDVR